MKLYSKLELDSMVSTFQAQVETVFENDVTDSISITNNGFKKYTKEEFNNLRNTFTAPFEKGQSKSLENNIDMEFPARATSITLWTLKSLTRLSMFMTPQQVADFFSVEKINIKSYTQTERNGKPNEYRKELIDAGLLSLTNAECKNLVQNFMDADSIHETLNGDMTDSWKIHSRGAVLYSLEAVMKKS